MIKGLRTAVYPAPDLAKAKVWYQVVFETPPYFDEPFYVGFQIGGFELGLVPDAPIGSGGPCVYWGVDSIPTELARLRSAGIVADAEPQDVGGGIRVVELVDPFGNRVGLIENPHFDLAKAK